MDGDAAPAGVEQLLAHFLTGALGLTLNAAVPATATPAKQPAEAPSADSDPLVWAAWKTDQGVVKISGAYNGPQSRRLNVHVLYLSWWMGPATRHEGWWRCDPRRPREWTRGYGGEPRTRGAEPIEKPGARARLNAA